MNVFVPAIDAVNVFVPATEAVNPFIEFIFASVDCVYELKDEVKVYLPNVDWSILASMIATPATTVAVIPEPVKFNEVAVPCRIPSSKIVVATDAVIPVI